VSLEIYNSWKPIASQHESTSDIDNQPSTLDNKGSGSDTSSDASSDASDDEVDNRKRGRSVSGDLETRVSKRTKNVHVVVEKEALFLKEGSCSSTESMGAATTRKVSKSSEHSTLSTSALVSPPPEYVHWTFDEIRIHDRVLGHDVYGNAFVNPWLPAYKIRPL